MMEVEGGGESRVFPASVATVHSHVGQRVTNDRVLILTITPEKIDCVMDDVRAQIEGLQHHLAKLRLARARVALFWAKERGEESHGVASMAATVCAESAT